MALCLNSHQQQQLSYISAAIKGFLLYLLTPYYKFLAKANEKTSIQSLYPTAGW